MGFREGEGFGEGEGEGEGEGGMSADEHAKLFLSQVYTCI